MIKAEIKAETVYYLVLAVAIASGVDPKDIMNVTPEDAGKYESELARLALEMQDDSEDKPESDKDRTNKNEKTKTK